MDENELSGKLVGGVVSLILAGLFVAVFVWPFRSFGQFSLILGLLVFGAVVGVFMLVSWSTVVGGIFFGIAPLPALVGSLVAVAVGLGGLLSLVQLAYGCATLSEGCQVRDSLTFLIFLVLGLFLGIWISALWVAKNLAAIERFRQAEAVEHEKRFDHLWELVRESHFFIVEPERAAEYKAERTRQGDEKLREFRGMSPDTDKSEEPPE